LTFCCFYGIVLGYNYSCRLKNKERRPGRAFFLCQKLMAEAFTPNPLVDEVSAETCGEKTFKQNLKSAPPSLVLADTLSISTELALWL